jgi:hypothetical protein
MNIYTRMICDTVVTTVPKSIVHCMVRGGGRSVVGMSV